MKIIYRLWWAFLLLLFAVGAFASRGLPPPRHRLPAEALILPMAALSLVKGGPQRVN